MVANVLVIEDDRDVREFLRTMLVENGYVVAAASKGSEAMRIVEKTQPDLILLDLGLPDMTGESLCKDIKKTFPDIPLIILTAKDKTSDIVSGLNLGADDYITKPFEEDVLMARIKARLRSNGKNSGKTQVSNLVLDSVTMQVKRGETEIHLTAQEFRLLEYIMKNKGKVLSRDMILNRIWLMSPDIDTRVVDVYVGYLRKKIDNNYKKKLIHSVRGFGYVIKE